MPTYYYTAVPGQSDPSLITAPNLPAALRQLRREGVRITALHYELPHLQATRLRLPTSEKAIFLRQLAAMIDSGTPLAEALQLLATEATGPRTEALLRMVADDVCTGIPFSDALARHPRAFGPLIVGTVRAAERSGDLVQALSDLAEQEEVTARVLRRAAAALTYPVVVLCMVGLLTFVGLAFLTPRHLELLQGLGVRELPFPTKVLAWLSSRGWMVAVGLVLLMALGMFMFGVQRQWAAPRSLGIDYRRLKLPLVGRLNLNLALAQLSSTLGVLLSQRVPAATALRLAGAASGNLVIDAAVRRAEAAVGDGYPLAEGLRESGVLPDSFVARAAVAERSGTLPDTMRRLGRYYFEQAEATTSALQAAVEPVTIILLAVTVGFVALGFFTPLIAIVAELSGV